MLVTPSQMSGVRSVGEPTCNQPEAAASDASDRFKRAESSGFPFSAIVGQDDMKLALMLAAIDPSIGGVLVLGDRGTGKSTCVRGLAAVLPEIDVVADCEYRCDPKSASGCCAACMEKLQGGEPPLRVRRAPVAVVDMPIGVTEDRVIGSLDIEEALVLGRKRFEPGLLAKANRGFLYIDEINLLDDHLVDLLLDASASGENVVERDGLSVRHPARFVLVGSGNPEEGELRPQLLDRFGLCVDVASPKELPVRVEAVKRRDRYDRDRAAFLAEWRGAEDRLRQKLADAAERLDDVEAGDEAIEFAAGLCMSLGTDGLRGELTLLRAARAVAALDASRSVSLEHIYRAAPLALQHRLRKDPLDDTRSTARIERALEQMRNP